MSLLPVVLACAFAPAPFDRPGNGAYLGADFVPGQNLMISGVFISSPALEAGLGSGDVIVAVDGARLNSVADLAGLLRKKKPGAVVAVVVRRGAQEVTIKVTLSAPTRALLGAWFVGNTLKLSQVGPDSPASRAGIQVNDTILAIDGKKFTTPIELVTFLKGKKPGDVVTLTIQRNNAEMKARVTLGKRPGY